MLRKQLEAMGACDEAMSWVGDRTIEQAWSECWRGDWMLWYAARSGADRRLIVLAACACVRLALRYVPVCEDRPKRAIEAAEAWARGETHDVMGRADEAWACATTALTRGVAYAAFAAYWAARTSYASSNTSGSEAALTARSAELAAVAVELASGSSDIGEIERIGETAQKVLTECARVVREIIPCPNENRDE